MTNSKGQVSLEEAKHILQFAEDQKITSLDTASVYGDSEKVLGLSANESFDIVSKIPAFKKKNSQNLMHRY